MTLFWILLGAIMASSLWIIYYKIHSVRKMSASAWILTLISVLWAGFTFGWMASSIIEGEMQAAGMGLLVFGILLIALVVITRAQIIRNKSVESKTNFNA